MNITVAEHDEIIAQATKIDAALEQSKLPPFEYLVIKTALLFLKLFVKGMRNAYGS